MDHIHATDRIQRRNHDENNHANSKDAPTPREKSDEKMREIEEVTGPYHDMGRPGVGSGRIGRKERGEPKGKGKKPGRVTDERQLRSDVNARPTEEPNEGLGSVTWCRRRCVHDVKLATVIDRRYRKIVGDPSTTRGQAALLRMTA
jgi:hypothetical protein